MLVVKKCQIKNTQYKDNENCNKHNFDLSKLPKDGGEFMNYTPYFYLNVGRFVVQ